MATFWNLEFLGSCQGEGRGLDRLRHGDSPCHAGTTLGFVTVVVATADRQGPCAECFMSISSRSQEEVDIITVLSYR